MAKRKARTGRDIGNKKGRLLNRKGNKQEFNIDFRDIGNSRVKIKRNHFHDFRDYSSSKHKIRENAQKVIIINMGKNKPASNKTRGNRLNAQKQRNFQKFERIKGLRSDSMQAKVSGQKKAEQQQKKVEENKPAKRDGLKLFTKAFDARKRIEARREKSKQSITDKVKENAKTDLDKSREQQKTANLSKKRELSIVGNKMQIVSKLDTEKEREAMFTGTSLRVTTLQTTSERLGQRETSQSGNSLYITTGGGGHDDVMEPPEETSAYSLFEARRKAQQASRVQMEPEQPKLSSLNPISRPRRPPPVHEFEEEHVSLGNSSKLLISNLHPNVSQDDIYELFAAIGSIRSARMLRHGVAEVVYESHQDAVNAHNKYHSRNLDGQPMICKLAAAEKQFYSPPSARQPKSGTASATNPVVFTVKI